MIMLPPLRDRPRLPLVVDTAVLVCSSDGTLGLGDKAKTPARIFGINL
jgi:hypothetical protein